MRGAIGCAAQLLKEIGEECKAGVSGLPAIDRFREPPDAPSPAKKAPSFSVKTPVGTTMMGMHPDGVGRASQTRTNSFPGYRGGGCRPGISEGVFFIKEERLDVGASAISSWGDAAPPSMEAVPTALASLATGMSRPFLSVAESRSDVEEGIEARS